MSRITPFRPASLAQYFDAPDDYVGEFGWLCAYSADEWFMDRAAERFTRQTKAQRAHVGSIALALMLDPGQPQLSPVDVPGVLHLPLRGAEQTQFRLMHAKVALLGFRHASQADAWRLRLVVSTGNWTRQTVEESLDLAWSVELSSAEAGGQDAAQQLARADLVAARDFIGWLREYFDPRVLYAAPPDRPLGLTAAALERVDAWCAGLRRPSNVTPRFFDNRRRSLLAQLPARIRANGRTTACNTLAMGSGFYEGGAGGVVPAVPRRIVEALQAADDGPRLLTGSAQVDLFINPQACQSIAASVEAIESQGWTVRAPSRPTFLRDPLPRFMHAKFIFGATYRDSSSRCAGAWLYLGSGNLTGPGFANPMSANGGNLEAGVVLAVDDLHWTQPKGVPPDQWVGNLLPVQWDEAIGVLDGTLAAGAEMPEPGLAYLAPPLPWCLWEGIRDSDGSPTGCLSAPQGSNGAAFEVLDPAGQACAKLDDHRFSWPDRARPRQVVVRWQAEGVERRATVPVLDEFNRVAASELPALDLDTAWDRLNSFPLPPEDEELDAPDAPPGNSEPEAPRRSSRARQAEADYPIRHLMQLVENIAARQTAMQPADWNAWCARLAQTLTQASGNPGVAAFAALGINPLSPLWHAPFRPGFAETAATRAGETYESVLRDLEHAWGVADLRPLGELA